MKGWFKAPSTDIRLSGLNSNILDKRSSASSLAVAGNWSRRLGGVVSDNFMMKRFAWFCSWLTTESEEEKPGLGCNHCHA